MNGHQAPSNEVIQQRPQINVLTDLSEIKDLLVKHLMGKCDFYITEGQYNLRINTGIHHQTLYIASISEYILQRIDRSIYKIKTDLQDDEILITKLK